MSHAVSRDVLTGRLVGVALDFITLWRDVSWELI